MAKPAGTQMSDTSGLATASTAPVTPARTGVMVANERIQAGDSVRPWRVSHRKMPYRISADPRTTRSQDAQRGGDLSRPPRMPEAATESAVSAASPSSQPPRKARPLGRGRGACKTSTAGMTVSGDSAMTSPSGTSPVSTEPQVPAMGSNLR